MAEKGLGNTRVCVEPSDARPRPWELRRYYRIQSSTVGLLRARGWPEVLSVCITLLHTHRIPISITVITQTGTKDMTHRY